MSGVFRYSDVLNRQLAEMQRRPKGERTRAALKAAAVRHLERDGYTGMSVAAITTATGVSRGTFYLYFANRKHIALEVLTEFAETVRRNRPGGGATRDAFDSIDVANRYYVGVYRKNAGLIRCMMQLGDEMQEFARISQDLNYAWAKKLVRDMSRRCAPRHVDDRLKMLLVYAMESMVDKLLRDLYVAEDPHLEALADSEGDLAECLSLIWYRALYARNPPAAKLTSTRPLLSLALREEDPAAIENVSERLAGS